MKRSLICAAALLTASPALAEDGTYRCMVEKVTHWSGDRAGTVDSLPPSEYEIGFVTTPDSDWARSITTGERFSVEHQPDETDQLLVTREDGRFSMRIDLDARPLQFAGLGTTALMTGTCFFEPRTTK